MCIFRVRLFLLFSLVYSYLRLHIRHYAIIFIICISCLLSSQFYFFPSSKFIFFIFFTIFIFTISLLPFLQVYLLFTLFVTCSFPSVHVSDFYLFSKLQFSPLFVLIFQYLTHHLRSWSPSCGSKAHYTSFYHNSEPQDARDQQASLFVHAV